MVIVPQDSSASRRCRRLTLLRRAARLAPALLPASVSAGYSFNFPEPVTPIARETLHIHNEFMLIITTLFVVVFAVYPFAAEMFKQSGIPKRLIPGTIALGAFTFTMDSLPGTPQIQNIIPTTFFKTDIYAAPILGTVGAIFILIAGLAYLDFCRRRAVAAGEGYGTNLVNEPEPFEKENWHIR